MAVNAFISYLPGLTAAGSLASAQYTPMQYASTAGQVKQATATTDEMAGILLNDPADGGEAEVAGFGSICRAIAGTAVMTLGAALTVNSTGVATTTTDNVNLVARCLEAPGASGDLITVQVLAGLRY